MDLSIYIISVFCLIDDWLEEEPKLRQRGPKPELADSEVLTIEVVGEFLGIDSEKDLFVYFRRHYGEYFPALREVHRTTFTRQAANLCGSLKSGCGSICSTVSASTRSSLWLTPSRCPCAGSLGATAAVSWLRRVLLATTR